MIPRISARSAVLAAFAACALQGSTAQAQSNSTSSADDRLPQIFNFLFTGKIEGEANTLIEIKDRANCVVELKQRGQQIVYYFNNVYESKIRLEAAGVYTQVHLYGAPKVATEWIGREINPDYRSIMVPGPMESVMRALSLLYRDYCKFKELPF